MPFLSDEIFTGLNFTGLNIVQTQMRQSPEAGEPSFWWKRSTHYHRRYSLARSLQQLNRRDAIKAPVCMGSTWPRAMQHKPMAVFYLEHMNMPEVTTVRETQNYLHISQWVLKPWMTPQARLPNVTTTSIPGSGPVNSLSWACCCDSQAYRWAKVCE